MWPRLISAAIGIWLMAAPEVVGYGGNAATSDRIVGPVVVMVSVIAASAVTRVLRWSNLPLGSWLLLAPWILGFGAEATINGTVSGVLLILLAFPAGQTASRFGGGWRSLGGTWGIRSAAQREDRRSRA